MPPFTEVTATGAADTNTCRASKRPRPNRTRTSRQKSGGDTPSRVARCIARRVPKLGAPKSSDPTGVYAQVPAKWKYYIVSVKTNARQERQKCDAPEAAACSPRPVPLRRDRGERLGPENRERFDVLEPGPQRTAPGDREDERAVQRGLPAEQPPGAGDIDRPEMGCPRHEVSEARLWGIVIPMDCSRRIGDVVRAAESIREPKEGKPLQVAPTFAASHRAPGQDWRPLTRRRAAPSALGD